MKKRTPQPPILDRALSMAQARTPYARDPMATPEDPLTGGPLTGGVQVHNPTWQMLREMLRSATATRPHCLTDTEFKRIAAKHGYHLP